MNKQFTRGLTLMVAVCVIYFAAFQMVSYQRSISAAAEADSPCTVIIDAGHGGEDGGATSVSGILEKQLNLEIALRLEQVMAFSGIRPMMIRDTDTAVYTGDCSTITEKKVSDLKNRVSTISEVPNALVISIHQNHFSEEKYAGAQVFYAPTDGSKDLAQLLQTQLRDSLNTKNRREIKPADSVYLMNHIPCTGVLVECGFLSNAKEDQLLQDTAYQKKLSAVLGCSLVQYITEGETPDEI